MRTTMDIPEDLMERAMKAAKVSTKTTAVRLGLQSLVEREHASMLLALRGKIKIAPYLKSSRGR